MKKKIFVLLCTFFLLCCTSIPILAASNEPNLSLKETKIFGLVPKNINSSLIWQSTSIMADVTEASNKSSIATTTNELETTYYIENPSYTETTEEFILPYYDFLNFDHSKRNDIKIKVKDKEIVPTLRTVPSESGMEFYNGTSYLEEDYLYTDTLDTNTSVHKITAKPNFEILQNETYHYSVKVPVSTTSSILTKGCSRQEQSPENCIFVFELTQTNPSFEISFVGDIPEYKIEDSINLNIETENMSLLDYSNEYLPNNMKQMDWYNFVIKKLYNAPSIFGKSSIVTIEELISPENLLSLLSFSVTFKPRETLMIETEMPLYLYPNLFSNSNYYPISGYTYSNCISTRLMVIGDVELVDMVGGEKTEGNSKIFQINGYAFQLVIDASLLASINAVAEAILCGLMIFFLFLIPMALMLIFFLRRKNKNGLKLLYLQKFFAYFLFFFGFLIEMLYQNVPIVIVLLCLYGILTLITLFHNLLKYQKSLGTLAIETISWFFIIYALATNDILGAGTAVWIFSLATFAYLIYNIHKVGKQDSSLPENILPVGILYRVEPWIIYLYFSLTTGISYIISEFIYSPLYFLLSLFVIFVLYFVGIILRYKYFLLKPFREFYKDLDLSSLEQKIQAIQNLKNIHPETINYYNILMFRNSLACDQEVAKKYLKDCYYPKTKNYIQLYRGISMRYGQTKEEFENGYIVLKKEYYKNQAYVKNLTKFYNFWLPYYGTNPTVDNIEKTYNYHKKNNEYNNAICLFILIYYYRNEGNLTKAEELKEEFIKKYSMMKEFINDLMD